MEDQNRQTGTTNFGQRFMSSFAYLLTLAIWMGLPGDSTSLDAQQVTRIWSPQTSAAKPSAPLGECYFRRKFTLIKPEEAQVELSAGDEYELYLNDRLVTRGESYGSTSKLDVSSYLTPGVNVVAVKVRHTSSDQPGLAMKIRIKEEGEARWRSLVTDGTWKTRTQLIGSWKQPGYNDMGWLKAVSLKVAKANSSTPPKVSAKVARQPVTPKPASKVEVATYSGDRALPVASFGRATAAAAKPARQVRSATKIETVRKMDREFEISDDFTVQQVLDANEAKSVIAMEFNEFGKLLLGRKNGPLMIADLSLPANAPGRIKVVCDKVTNCSGILPVNGSVYVTADGPSGLALYRLSDTENNGILQPTRALMKFTGESGSHGPHGLRLGPDGMIYIALGNGSRVDKRISKESVYRFTYEGDLVKRLEDPAGHAAGVKAPGGTIVRCSLDGSKIETFAGGLRNAMNMVFNEAGELFVHDSDNPADIGTPWYRPSALYHVTAGAELGWRSGWSKFSDHFVDVSPAIVATGSGQPGGIAVYRHLQFPASYHGLFFTANKTTGEIDTIKAERSGAGFIGSPEKFLRCRSLQLSDLAIGEDGSLYFGATRRAHSQQRDSNGGVYRVVWNGTVPDQMLDFETDLARVIRHPQPDSVWARQNIAQLKIAMGREWAKAIRGVIDEPRNPTRYRVRAMQLMVLYGPSPSPSMLTGLAGEQDPEIRAQVAQLCSTLDARRSEAVLRSLITDPEPFVRRTAAEAMLKLNLQPEFALIADMLASDDRTEAGVARKLLERTPSGRWKDEVLATDSKRLFIQGAVALMAAEPELKNSYDLLARGSEFMDGFLSDTDFVDLLRTMQLALAQGNVDPEQIPGFATRIANEFPAGSSQLNTELVHLMAGLRCGNLEGRLEAYLKDADVLPIEKFHAAMRLQAVGANLTDQERLSIVEYLESVKGASGTGESYVGYIRQAIAACGAELTEPQVDQILAEPERYASSIISAFYKLPETLDDDTVQKIIDLDSKFVGKSDDESMQIRLGAIAVLAQDGGEQAMQYLRTIWQSESDRRGDIAIGLAQQPKGENWAYLVSSLPLLSDDNAEEVLSGLLSVARKPRDARHFHDVIGLAENLKSDAAATALKLLQHWAGDSATDVDSTDRVQQVAAWKAWCAQTLDSSASASRESTTEAAERF